MIPGVTVNLGGEDFVVPPLNFKALRALQPKLALIDGIAGRPTDEQMDALVETVHMALQRNYPDLTREKLEDILDMGNAPPAIRAIMGASGLAQQGERPGNL